MGIVIGIVAAVVALANDYYLDYNACNNMIRNAGNQYVSAGIDCVNRASFTNSSGKVCRYKWEPLSNAANVIGGECTVQSGACVVDCS